LRRIARYSPWLRSSIEYLESLREQTSPGALADDFSGFGQRIQPRSHEFEGPPDAEEDSPCSQRPCGNRPLNRSYLIMKKLLKLLIIYYFCFNFKLIDSKNIYDLTKKNNNEE